MAHEIVIPRLGWSMEEGTFISWLKKDGDRVQRGEAIFELEGEKALQEIEAVDEGILRIPSTGPTKGSIVKVGTVIGYLVAAGESTPFARLSLLDEVASPQSVNPAPDDSPVPPIAAPSVRRLASPRARRIASELEIDWTRLSGTGVGGRVRESDVRAAAAQGVELTSAITNGQRLTVTSRRRIISKRMVASRQSTVPVTLTTKADATNLVKLRDQYKTLGGSTRIPSYQDIITKLVAEALQCHPMLACRWEEDAIVVPADNQLHLGMAVDTEDGLVVPVIRNVGELTLDEIAQQSGQMVEKARAGKLVAADMQGGVFTITNLGAFGIDAFTPIINSPETAILGLGAIRLEPFVLDDGVIVARHQLSLSLTFDHRIVDGAPAARFLQAVVNLIASFA